jgi:hypothetical protein
MTSTQVIPLSRSPLFLSNRRYSVAQRVGWRFPVSVLLDFFGPDGYTASFAGWAVFLMTANVMVMRSNEMQGGERGSKLNIPIIHLTFSLSRSLDASPASLFVRLTINEVKYFDCPRVQVPVQVRHGSASCGEGAT